MSVVPNPIQVSKPQNVAPLPQKYLTIPGAAAAYSVTIWFIRKLIWADHVRVFKPGKAFLIPIEDLDREFAEMANGKEPPPEPRPKRRPKPQTPNTNLQTIN